MIRIHPCHRASTGKSRGFFPSTIGAVSLPSVTGAEGTGRFPDVNVQAPERSQLLISPLTLNVRQGPSHAREFLVLSTIGRPFTSAEWTPEMTSYHLTFTAILKDDASLKCISSAFASIHAQLKVLLHLMFKKLLYNKNNGFQYELTKLIKKELQLTV